MKVRGCLLTFLQLAILWTGLAQGRSTVRLLVADSEAPAGSEVPAAIELTPPKGWHTYWRNPGDSGQRTKVQWTLPDGVTAGDLLWPAPAIHSDGGLTTYVYEGRVLLLLRLRVASNAAAGPLSLSARVSWLECEKECVPGRATVTGTLRVGSARVASPDSAAIESAIAGLPKPDPGLRPTAAWDGPAGGDERPLLMSIPAPAASGFKAFLPYEHSDVELGANPESVTAGDGSAHIRIKVTKTGADWPAAVAGLFAFEGGRVVEAEAPIAPADEPAGDGAGNVQEIAGTPSLLWMLGFAFLGGLILNVMPCVLPVIALKILGFVKQSQEQPGRVRLLGLVYTLGVLCSFAVLAAVVIGLQSAGRSASWGMQFQNPVFVVLITTLVTLVALNLFGVFEITLTSGAAGAASGLASRGGVPGAFFNGVFTTILATPCTAPFLGVALGFAFSQPPLLLLLLLLTVGLGLAAPYLVLSLQPGWLKFLPRPGNWMITFKMLMGFPMLGTAIWLLTLAQKQFGPKGVFWLGMFLVLVSLAAWLYGRSIQAGQGNRRAAWGGVAASLIIGWVFILERELQWRSPPRIADVSSAVVEEGIDWAPWSSVAIQAAQAQGRPVLVDFTAEWCATCQINKKMVLQTDTVTSRLKSLNVVTLRGDFTLEDPAIETELRRFQRRGVPLVLVYPGRPGAPPRVLPEFLTTGLVLEALDWAGRTEAVAGTR